MTTEDGSEVCYLVGELTEKKRTKGPGDAENVRRGLHSLELPTELYALELPTELRVWHLPPALVTRPLGQHLEQQWV